MALAMPIVALGIVLILGTSLVAACPSPANGAREPGRLPRLLGAGYLVGVLALTLLMRAEAAMGVPFGLATIGLPAAAIAAACAAYAWRRSPALAETWRGSLATLRGDASGGFARVAWFALLAWIGLRVALLASEVALRPLYAWDAWSAWATKAKTYFAMRTLVPFVDAAGWATSTTPVWFDAAPHQPVTLPLLQAWIATAAGAWDDASAALPWVAFFVAIVLVVYGEVRRRGATPLYALASAWLAGSLPLVGTQVALAGYADLPLAAAFTLGALAGLRAIATRSPVDVVVALAALMLVATSKSSAWTWLVVVLPGFAAAALGTAWHRRIGILLVVASLAVVGIAARFPAFALGPVSFRYAPVWENFAIESLLFANWHLIAPGIAGVLALRRRRCFDAEMAPLTLILAAGALWIAMLAAFPAFRAWGADHLGLNRAVLVLAPFAIAWMAIAMLRAAPAEVPASTADPEPAPQPA